MRLPYAILIGFSPFILTYAIVISIYKYGVYAFVLLLIVLFAVFVTALTKMQ